MAALLAAGAVAPVSAQLSREAGVDLLAVASRPAQWLAGGSGWWRVAPRTRIGVLGGVGSAGGGLAGRVELAGHFLLNPAATRGIGLHAGGGVAVAAGDARGARVQLLVGAEQRPGSPRGWVVEAGVGGGVRLAVGWRWRSGGATPRRP